MESQKLTAKFTASRAVRIVSPTGDRCMNFEAGETRPVHRELFAVAIAAGLMPEEPLAAQSPGERVETDAGIIEIPPTKQTQEEMVQEGLLEACKTLIARGDPHDFTQLGQPRAASVKKLVDFDFTARDVRDAFEQAMFEVENAGTDEAKTEVE